MKKNKTSYMRTRENESEILEFKRISVKYQRSEEYKSQT